MSAPVKSTVVAAQLPIVRHLSMPELAHAFSLCGIPRQDRPTVDDIAPGEELCVVCEVEYERIRGFKWQERKR